MADDLMIGITVDEEGCTDMSVTPHVDWYIRTYGKERAEREIRHQFEVALAASFDVYDMGQNDETMSATKNIETRKGYEWWDQFVALKRYSFLLGRAGENNFVKKVEFETGGFVDVHQAGELVEAMQEEINRLTIQAAARSPNTDVAHLGPIG